MSKLATPDIFIDKCGGLLKGTVFGLIHEHLLKGKEEPLTIQYFCDRTGESEGRIRDSLSGLEFDGLISKSDEHDWEKIGSFIPQGLAIQIGTAQLAMDMAGSASKAKAKQAGRYAPGACGDEDHEAHGETYRVFVGQGGEGDSRIYLTIERLKDHTFPFQGVEYSNAAEAWKAADEYIEELRRRPAVIVWALALPEDGKTEEYDNEPFVYVDGDTFAKLVAESLAEKDDDAMPQTLAIEGGEYRFGGRRYISDENGTHWPGLDTPAAEEEDTAVSILDWAAHLPTSEDKSIDGKGLVYVSHLSFDALVDQFQGDPEQASLAKQDGQLLFEDRWFLADHNGHDFIGDEKPAEPLKPALLVLEGLVHNGFIPGDTQTLTLAPKSYDALLIELESGKTESFTFLSWKPTGDGEVGLNIAWVESGAKLDTLIVRSEAGMELPGYEEPTVVEASVEEPPCPALEATEEEAQQEAPKRTRRAKAEAAV